MVNRSREVCLKAGSFATADRLGVPVTRRRRYMKGWKGGVRYVRPTDVHGDAVGTPAPVRAVIFPTWAGHDEPRLVPMSGARAVFRLAGLVLNQHVYGAHMISLLGRLVRGAKCYALESGAVAPTCALIESVVDAA